MPRLPRTMITFDVPGARFSARVGGVCLRDGHVLLQSSEAWANWVVPGGRWEIGETSEESLRRELREEIDSEVEVERLLWVSENFFEHESHFFHEIGLYYLVSLPADVPHLALDAVHTTVDNGTEIYIRWFSIDDLPRVYPLFMPSGLRDLPAHPTRVVDWEVT